MKIDRFGQAEPLSKDQFRKVLNAIANPKHRLIFALCWYTTDRPGAVLKLQVHHVYSDPARRVPREKILLPKTIRKDSKTREVPVSPALRSELKAYQPPLSGFLFPGEVAETCLSFSAYSKALMKIYDSLGLRGYSTYSTRRGSLTTLAKAGLSLRKIQSISGHSSLACLQRYLEVTEAEVSEAMGLL